MTSRPNISGWGCRRRTRFGWEMGGLTAAALAAVMLFHAPWFLRLLVFFPAAASATGFLQVHRQTCVLRAREGTFEHDDGSTTQAPEEHVRASRLVARTIQRDAALIGLGAAAVAAVLAFV